MNAKKLLFFNTDAALFNSVIVFALLLGSLALPSRAYALGFAIQVNTTADNTTKDGLCSLREAIVNANKNWQFYTDCTQGASDDGIFFSNSLGTATITLNSALPPITDFVGLSINGGGDITIDGNHNQYRVFLVNNRVPLTLESLIIKDGGIYNNGSGVRNGGGLLSNGGFVTIMNSTFRSNRADNGGGIYNNGGNVKITNSTFQGNAAGINVPGDNDGGGIYNNGGSLVIAGSTFSGNGVYSDGGGIYSSGTTTITDSTFSTNNAYVMGGGIYVSSGETTITNSTFSRNGDQFIYGGGIYVASGTLSITKSTFSDNRANLGGGVFVSSGTSTIANSTFSGNTNNGVVNIGTTTITNSTFSGNNDARLSGAGISNQGTLYLFNSILANSTTGADCYSQGFVTGNNNLIEINSTSPNNCGTAALTSDPALRPLTGSPAYFPLNAGSPAINAGDDAICAAAPVNNTSQNGLARPQGAHCEIGSFESPLLSLTGTPQEQAAGMGTDIWSLIDTGVISADNGKNLTSKLDGFIEVMDKGDTQSGLDTLNGFIGQTNTFVKSGELDEANAQLLIDKAQAIIESIDQSAPAEK